MPADTPTLPTVVVTRGGRVALEQQPRRVDVAVVGGDVQRGPAVVRRPVDGRVVLDDTILAAIKDYRAKYGAKD